MNDIKLEKLKLTQEWGKTYPEYGDVNHKKVLFANGLIH